jgi:hypothetical protein
VAKEICTIFNGNNGLDNDYTIYSNGTIKHSYDRHAFALNNEEMTTVDELSTDKKKKLLDKCPKEHKEKVKKIFKM